MVKEKEPLSWLESLQYRAKQLRAEEAVVKEKIRSGFVDCAIIFIDVIGSTEFKQVHKDSPDIWILRVRQFSELLASAVSSSGGKVIKYIGDEVMAVFDNIYNAQDIVGRIEEIEQNLKEATGFDTKVKVAADFGKVYFLNFPGHDEPDPQGPVVDRCARIAKYGQPGEVLASADFAVKTSKLVWKKVGSIDLKGLGMQLIFQLGRVTVDLMPMISVKEQDFQTLLEKAQELEIEVLQIREKNKRLAKDLENAGKKPSPMDLAESSEDADKKWEKIEELIEQLKYVIEKAPVPKNQYVRFLILWNIEKPLEYNRFTGETFDDSIEAGLVTEIGEDSGYYELESSHPRNEKAFKLMVKIEDALEDYLAHYDRDPDDLFHWSLKDSEFWDNYVIK